MLRQSVVIAAIAGALLLAACRTPTPVGTAEATPSRSAELHELVEVVEAREAQATAFAPASEGQTVNEAGEVRTGQAGKARMDLSDGTVVRLAPNTLFVLEGLEGTDADPLTRLQFSLGKLWVSLVGGEFQAETPVGVATVRGSYAEFTYDPGADPDSILDDVLTIKCIEGECTFSDGTQTIVLGNLEQVIIRDGGATIIGPTPLPDSAVDEFLANSPESAPVVLTLTAAAPSPTPTRTAAPSDTPPPTPTDTATPAPSDTPLPSPTRTPQAPSDTPPPSASATRTLLPVTATPSNTAPPTATFTPSATETEPPAPLPPSDTPPPTFTPSLTPSPTITWTPSRTPTPTRTPGPTKTPSPTP